MISRCKAAINTLEYYHSVKSNIVCLTLYIVCSSGVRICIAARIKMYSSERCTPPPHMPIGSDLCFGRLARRARVYAIQDVAFGERCTRAARRRGLFQVGACAMMSWRDASSSSSSSSQAVCTIGRRTPGPAPGSLCCPNNGIDCRWPPQMQRCCKPSSNTEYTIALSVFYRQYIGARSTKSLQSAKQDWWVFEEDR